MDLPKTMRVALTEKPGEAFIEERPVPTPGPGELLVKTAIVGVCAGDVAAWYVARKVPAVLGHEPAGTVVAVGEGVSAFGPGDRVFFHHHAPCFECPACLKGEHSTCDEWRSSHLIPGALAEYVLVPAANAKDTLLLPDEVSFEAASFVEPLACCVKAYNRVGLRPGESVVVIGLGSMGQLCARLARARGASRVIGTDLVPSRLAAGLRVGCDAVVDARAPDLVEQVLAANGGRPADVVLVGPGAIPAMEQGLALVARGGRWCCFWPTPPGEELAISPHRLYFDEITLHFSYSCGPRETREALAYIRTGAVPVVDLITHRFPLEEAGKAFEITGQAGDSLKALVIVHPETSQE